MSDVAKGMWKVITSLTISLVGRLWRIILSPSVISIITMFIAARLTF